MRPKALAVLLALAMADCSPLVSRFAFFPEREAAVALNNPRLAMREVRVATEDGKTLQCVLLADSASHRLVIYFHGNAGNISQRIDELLALRQAGASALGVSYRGFGGSSGRPSEKGIYRDGDAAYRYALDSLGYRPDQVYLVGRSIGTTVAITTAVHHRVAGLVLVTPLTTGRAYVRFHGLGPLALLSGNAFDNLGKCRLIACPVLVIHGTNDEVVPYWMGQRVYSEIRTAKAFVTIQGGFHNDLENTDPASYWSAIASFIDSSSSRPRAPHPVRP